MCALAAVTLADEFVVLEPLGPRHRDDLAEAVADGELWNLSYTRVPTPESMEREIERRLALNAAGTMLPFAAIDRGTGRAIGMTTYMNVEPEKYRLEIGSTWYRKTAQRTALNTAAKRLLLTHAFERLDCIAVEFRTSRANLASRRAIERLGAKRDGILRSDGFHADGTLRDTYVYSIVAAEWPDVRASLTARLSGTPVS